MARKDEENQNGDARRTCTPCAGRGKVISNLGGERSEVTCPWCGGTGEFQPGLDAQETGEALRRRAA